MREEMLATPAPWDAGAWGTSGSARWFEEHPPLIPFFTEGIEKHVRHEVGVGVCHTVKLHLASEGRQERHLDLLHRHAVDHELDDGFFCSHADDATGQEPAGHARKMYRCT